MRAHTEVLGTATVAPMSPQPSNNPLRFPSYRHACSPFAGPTQKHSALRLAAALVDLLGPQWLMQPPPPPPARLPASPSPAREVPFLCVLAEILLVSACRDFVRDCSQRPCKRMALCASACGSCLPGEDLPLSEALACAGLLHEGGRILRMSKCCT